MWQIHTDILLIGCYLHPLGHCIHVHATKSLQACIYCNHDCIWLRQHVQSNHLSTEIFSVFPFNGSGPSLWHFPFTFMCFLWMKEGLLPSLCFFCWDTLKMLASWGVSRVSSPISRVFLTLNSRCWWRDAAQKRLKNTHRILETHIHRSGWGGLWLWSLISPIAVNQHHITAVWC